MGMVVAGTYLQIQTLKDEWWSSYHYWITYLSYIFSVFPVNPKGWIPILSHSPLSILAFW